MQMRDLSLVMLGAMKAIPMMEAFDLKHPQSPSTTELPTTSSNILSDMISSLRLSEYSLLFLSLMLFLISLITTYAAVRRALSRRSFIYLEIGSKTEIAQLKLFQFPNATRYYGVKTSRKSLVLSITSYGLASKLTVTANNWYFWDFLSGNRKALPSTLWVAPWTARKVARILRADHSVTTLVVHTHEYIFANSKDIVGPYGPTTPAKNMNTGV